MIKGQYIYAFIFSSLTVFVLLDSVRAQKPEENGALVSEDLTIEEILAEEFLDDEIKASSTDEKGLPDDVDELLMELEIDEPGGVIDDLEGVVGDDELMLDDALAEDTLEIEEIIPPIDEMEDDVEALLATEAELEAAEVVGRMTIETPAGDRVVSPRVSSVFATESGREYDPIRLAHEREQTRRRALAQHAAGQMQQAREAQRKKNYLDARRLYEQAINTLEKVGARPETRADLERARQELLTTVYKRAEVLYSEGDFVSALALADEASRSGHPKASRLAKRIRKDQEDPPVRKSPRRWEEPSYLEKQAEIKAFLRRGRQHYMVGEYKEAQNNFESVLNIDQFNTEAIRWREKVAIKMHDRTAEEVESTRRAMMYEVRRRWNAGEYRGVQSDVIDDVILVGRESLTTDELTRKKMEEIIIPEVDFIDSDITAVVLLLKQWSREYDPVEGGKGVSFVLKLDAPTDLGGEGDRDDFDLFDEEEAGAAPGGGITFGGYDHTLLEVLNIVTSLAGLRYRIEGSFVLIVPENYPQGDLIRRGYPVLPTLRERITSIGDDFGSSGRDSDFISLTGSGGFGEEQTDWKEFFGRLGVEWPTGSEIQYLSSISKIMVKNTAQNLAVFESVLADINVLPQQVEIEARFVEINQSDLMSIGFEYFITDEWEVAQKASDKNKPLSQRQRVVVEESELTIGERFLNDPLDESGTVGGVEAPDNILAFSSFLTNPDLRMVIHALEQKGNADLLSAPKIMTRSGQEAQIKVVTEYIYPSDYTVEPGIAPTVDSDGVPSSSGVPPLVTPAEFETREVGVILNVLPEVTPDGDMINLTLSPEVVTEPEWFDYGQTFIDGITGQVNEILIQQPFFNSRSIQTTILVYNGATVVMGGMITEERTQVEDKIPFLGDIPILGRFFRSNYDSSVKRNLLIFVTARRVDPSGRSMGRRPDRQAEQQAGTTESSGS